MFTDVLKIIPKLDEKDLRAMEKSLQGRFTRLAKSFGKGLVNTLKGGGIAGIALGLIDKLLNPLKEVQEAIDRTLKSSDDLATNAKQFNTTTGKLAKLTTLGKATGLDPENLFTLMTKFQAAVAEAKADPTKPTAVKNYVDQADTAEAFFGFIQQLQKMDRNQQILVQQSVFGEKQILKMADFLNSDFSKVIKSTGIGKISTDKATNAINKNADLSDLQDELTAGREFRDLIKKSGVITEGMIRARDKSEQIALDRENQRIASYENLAAISDTVEKIMVVVEKGVSLLGSFITTVTPMIQKLTTAAEKLLNSPFMRGIKGLFGKGE